MKSHIIRIALALVMSPLAALAPAAEAPLPTPPPDLLGHWSFDAGTLASVGGWTGQLQGGAKIGESGAVVGTGCYHNGVGEGFLQTDLISLDDRSPFSVSAWLRSNGTTGQEDTLFGWGGSGYQGHLDFCLLNGNLKFLLERSSTTLAMPTPLNDGQWHHLLISCGLTNSRINTIGAVVYLNGKRVGSPKQSITFNSWTQSGIRIGTGYQRSLVSGGPPERDFNGSLDDFALFNTVLSASDAALIHGLAKLAGVNTAAIQPGRSLGMSPTGAVAEIGGRSWTKAVGLTGSTGDYGGSVATGDAWIALDDTGGGIRLLTAEPPPSANPLALEQVPATLTVRSGERASFPFQLRNTGGNPIDWKLRLMDSAERDDSLDAVLGRFVRQSPALLGSLPAQIDFTGGVTGTQIDSPPFNGGNILKTSLGGPLAYSNGVSASSPALGNNGRYFTLKLPGVFLFAGDFDGPAWFEAGGQTSSYTSAETQTIEFTHAGRQWKAYAVKRSYSFGSKSVNQLILIDDANAHLTPILGYSDPLMNARVNFSGKRRICYAMFTVSSGGDAKWTPFENLSRTILDLLSDVPSGTSVNPASGTLAGGGIASCNLEIDAQQMLTGAYPLAIDAQPAGGGAERVQAPVTLQIEEPAIRLGATTIDRAGIIGGPTETVQLATASANGSEQAWTARLLNAGDWVTLLTPAGTTPGSVNLRFTPTSSASVGLLRATLEIRTGNSTYLVPISYAVATLNPINLTMDPLRDRAYVLNLNSVAGMVVVMNTSRNTVSKVIRVGRGPSDIAFSPNGSEVYVLSATDLEIARIDPVTFEVTAKRQVPGTILSSFDNSWPMARLAVGSNGRTYYTDATSSPPLRMLDFNTGEVLDTLTSADIPKVSSTSTGFGDLFIDPHTGHLYFTRRSFSITGYPRIGRIEVGTDQLMFIEEWTIATSNSIYSTMRILSDLDGKRFHVDKLVYDRADMSKGQALYANYVTDISAYGHLVMTSLAIHDGLTGQKLVNLPVSTEIAAFTRNQAGIYYHAGYGKFEYWPLPEAIRPPAIALRPEPPDGGAIEQGQSTLRWSSLPQVDGYRVYLGTTAAAVAAAQPGSALDMGVVTTNSFTMDPAPVSGTFYWRIDALRGGTIVPGSVFSFSVAPFRVTPREIEVIAPHGALPQRVTLAATDGDGNPVAWSISSTSSWIKFPQASGTTNDALRVDLDPAGLALGSHAGTLKVTGAGLTIEIPVSLQLFQVDLYRLRPDPNRPVVYGLQTGELRGLPGYIIPIDTATGKYISAIPLEIYATDFAVHPHEDRLYVPLKYEKRIQVFDLKSGGALPSIGLADNFAVINSIAPGRLGRILVDASDSGSSSFGNSYLIDTATGTSLAEIDDGYSSYYKAVGTCDWEGTRYYRASLGKIQRVDVSTDKPVLLESGDYDNSLNYNWEFSNLEVSRNGGRLLSNQTILTADLRRIASVEKNAHAITGDGQLVGGPTGLYWADTGFKAASLPITYSDVDDGNRVVFSADDRFVVIWDDANKRTLSLPLSSLIGLPGPYPRPGQQLTETPGSLTWGSVTGAMEYQVFLGTNQAAVNSAGIGSPLRIGTSPTNTLVLSNPLAMGYRYYWRVDALTPGGVVKGTVNFFDFPFQSSGNPIVQPGTISSYGAGFGASLAPGPDGLMVGQAPTVKWFEFDWTSGAHRFVQELRDGESYSTGGYDIALAAGPDLMVAGNPRYGEPTSNAGAAFIHRKAPDGSWFRTLKLPFPPDASTSYFGNELAYDANQLLIQQGSTWQTSGRVFPYFEWPDWRRGPELVPNPIEQYDFFGAAIALDGTRALIGAPGDGTSYQRKGSAFVFEHDAPGKRWVQRARLQPAQGGSGDFAGLSVALAGNHAVLGPGDQWKPFDDRKVHVFNRRSTTSWIQNATLNDPDPLSNFGSTSEFGRTLAIHGDILFVSAPFAEWRGQRGGVVYPYRYNGSSWDAMAPIVPPPGGSQFGAGMTVHNGWLFISHYREQSSSTKPDQIFVYRLADPINREPLFVTQPPVLVVSGRASSFEVMVEDPDGNAGLVFRPANLPAGLTLQDLGNGRARITGIPTDPAGTERWLRLAVADAQGSEAVQTSLVEVLSMNDLPVLGGLPGSLELKEGEDLDIVPTIQGRGPFTWQWRRDGSDLPDATGPSLFIPGAGAASAGRYSVTVTNVVGSMTSGDIIVIVRPADRFAGNWTSFGGASDRDGHQPAALGRHRFQHIWQTQPVGEPPVNPVAVADGTVFFTEGGNHRIMSARAHALSTGAPLWSHVFASASRVEAPTWHNGRLYIQRSNHSSDSQLWCLDAGTGSPLWSSPFSTQFSDYEAPAVSDIGVFIAGGYGSGIYGHDFDGTRRFFRDLPQYDGWTPVISRQRLYTWVEGKFIEHDTQTGLPLWTFNAGWKWQAWPMDTVPVVKGPRAYLLGIPETICIDTDTRQVIWRIPRRFSGSPALAMDRLLVLSGGDVFALSTADGSEMARYASGAPGNRPLHGQPLALNDHLIVSNTDKTYVFDIRTAELMQTIPHGGHAAYSDGHLLIAGTDGILRAYFANAAPEFAKTMPRGIQANDAADQLVISLAPYAGDPDPGDPLTWAIVSVSRPEVFRTLEIQPQSGDLTVIYNPWQAGSSDVVVSVTDSAGNVTEHTITFTVPPHPEPKFEFTASLKLNRQTGLYEHAITVTNTGAREIAGFDLRIIDMLQNVTVNNASGRDGDDWIIHHRQPLAAGASVDLVIEYYIPVRGTVIDPQVAVGLVTVPETHPDAPDGGLAVERCVRMEDSTVMIEFAATPGALYEIHYSSDAQAWKLSPVRVRAAGNRVQWIDSGPPRTETPPSGEPCRFYRVREIPEP